MVCKLVPEGFSALWAEGSMQAHPTPNLYIVASRSLPFHHWRQALYSDQYLIPACAISCRCPGNTDVTQIECNKSFPLSKRNWVFVQRAVIWDYLHHVWSCSTLVMPVLRGKSSAEQVTLQSSQEKNNDGKTQAASEQRNPREDRGWGVGGRGSQLGRRPDEAHFLHGEAGCALQHM